MRVLLVSAEAVPYAKTGGLADVAGSIPKSLRALGQDVALVLPYYRQAREQFADQVADTGIRFTIPVGPATPTAAILRSVLPGSDVPVYFVANADYFDREQLYGTPAGDYADNCERFVFFSRAVVEAAMALEWVPEVFHCNDWQSALIPVYLQSLYAHAAPGRARTLLTIHNLAYQGLFPAEQFALTGLGQEHFTIHGLEFYGKLNLLKGGLIHATLLNTVSRRYAREIQTPGLGCGLDGVLADRAADLHGVLNGIDYTVWDPAVDELIPANYCPDDLAGKAICKRDLQQQCGLPARDVPLLGLISRLADQKGLDLIADIMDDLMQLDVQFVLLGTGEQKYHDLFARLAKRHPAKFSAQITFNNELAHRIEAGADIFLMPSRYEPCGLNQLYSLRYGAVPLVHKTGGLADTITNCTPSSMGKGTANGFSFQSYAPRALLATIVRALKLHADRRHWRRLMLNGMRQDWSWDKSAREYLTLYEKALA